MDTVLTKESIINEAFKIQKFHEGAFTAMEILHCAVFIDAVLKQNDVKVDDYLDYDNILDVMVKIEDFLAPFNPLKKVLIAFKSSDTKQAITVMEQIAEEIRFLNKNDDKDKPLLDDFNYLKGLFAIICEIPTREAKENSLNFIKQKY